MGLFNFFKTQKNQHTTIKSYEEHLFEIGECYQNFFTDMSRPLKECGDRDARAILIGSEIPLIAHFDFENFNTLLFNNINLEIKDKHVTFMQEQCTFYVLYSDRYLFSQLGNEDRNQVMDKLENGYLNKMMKLANNNETVWHYYKKHILEREKETPQGGSMTDFLKFYNTDLIHRLDLKKDYFSVLSLFSDIIFFGTAKFTMQMLSTLKNEEE